MIEYNQGQRIGDITFIKEVERKSKYIRIGIFRCICGNEFETTLTNVKAKITRSCGCSRNKLNNRQVGIIRRLIWEDNLQLQIIANRYKVAVSTIWNIKVENTYKNA